MTYNGSMVFCFQLVTGKTDGETDQNSLVTGKNRPTFYPVPLHPLIDNDFQEYPAQLEQAGSRREAVISSSNSGNARENTISSGKRLS